MEYYDSGYGAVARLNYAPTVSDLAQGKTVTTSSVEDDDPSVNGAKTVDGNGGTRWSSAYSDPQWMVVDLGEVKAIDRVKINWETSFGSAYEIQVSNDASNWTTVYGTTE